jgi:hypothetical protein
LKTNIEVRIPRETIGKYDLEFNRKDFMLLNKRPPALPRINVESTEKQKTKLSEIPSQTNSCTQVEAVVN